MTAPRLIAITPGDHGRGRDLTEWLLALADAGLRHVLIREPHLDEWALDALVLSAWGSVPEVVVHDRHPWARKYGAPLHLPEGGSASGYGNRWSRSCHDAGQVAAALDAGADWVTLSPVWAPRSKPDDRRDPLGPERFLAVAHGRPVVALGGIDGRRARELWDGGAAGVAVCGLLFDAADPAEAARRLRALER